MIRLLDLSGLAEKGIRFSDTHIWRLVRAGEFPQPMRIGRRAYWSEAEIDGFIEERLARRNRAKQALKCEECGIHYADPPSKLCPGCQAYQEHQR